MYNLITRCWDQTSSDRPAFSEIVEILKDPGFISDSGMNVDSDDFLAYLDYLDKQVCSFNSNPKSVLSIESFITNKQKSSIQKVFTKKEDNQVKLKKEKKRKSSLFEDDKKDTTKKKKISSFFTKSKEKKKLPKGPFIDIEKATANNETEEKISSETAEIVNTCIFERISNYKDAQNLSKKAFVNPKDETIKQNAVQALLKNLELLKEFYEFSLHLESSFCSTIKYLMNEVSTKMSSIPKLNLNLDFFLKIILLLLIAFVKFCI